MEDNTNKVTDLFFHQPPSSAFETTKKHFHILYNIRANPTYSMQA